ncbi:MAG: tryptophan synthase subunit alpha [Candidatus Peregrinibacteria bacterium]
MNTVMTHIVAGYPTMRGCEKTAISMARAGVKFIEIQIPFSDPVADGPVIMRANQAALSRGVRVADCFELMSRLRRRFDLEGLEVSLLFMTYYNILFRYGVGRFCEWAAACGCYGLIVPDIPFDEGAEYLAACESCGLCGVQVVSPIVSEERLRSIGEVARGMVYCVSRYGTTGVRGELNVGLETYLKRVRKHISVPLAVGFGISSRGQVEAVLRVADIAVVGSALIDGDLTDLKKLL